ncbi:MAG TPA: hypothetical protein VK509_02220 [Polyangiales bacterium]|nr:hypothetical protein [Polyangiales bacterium]
MASSRYPLDAVASARRAARTRAEGELAGALRALARSEQTRAEAAERLAEHAAAAPAAEPERPVLHASGLELQRAAAYAHRQASTARALRAALEREDEAVTQAQAEVRRAQAALAAAHGQEQLIERDRERFLQAQRRAAERAEQDEQEGG